jgi:hypothetical protein
MLPFFLYKENDKLNWQMPVIEDIFICQNVLAELNKILNSGCSRGVKRQAVKTIAGGYCCICGVIPTKIVRYKSDDASVIERYCDSCFEKRNLKSEY